MSSARFDRRGAGVGRAGVDAFGRALANIVVTTLRLPRRVVLGIAAGRHALSLRG